MDISETFEFYLGLLKEHALVGETLCGVVWCGVKTNHNFQKLIKRGNMKFPLLDIMAAY